MSAKRDQNRIPALLGLNNDESDVSEWTVDPITNELLIDLYVGTISPIPDVNISPKDQNYVPAMLGVKESAQEVNALRTQNNYLIIELI